MTTETYIGSDAAGNETICTFTVTVLDTLRPQITCAPDTIVGTDIGLCSANINVAMPTAVDNCADITFHADVFNTNHANGIYTPDSTVILWSATDTSGNVNTCRQKVTVIDWEPPTATCNSEITLQLDGNGNASISANDIDDGSTDNCAVNFRNISQSSFETC